MRSAEDIEKEFREVKDAIAAKIAESIKIAREAIDMLPEGYGTLAEPQIEFDDHNLKDDAYDLSFPFRKLINEIGWRSSSFSC